jgi:hypothetical protein
MHRIINGNYYILVGNAGYLAKRVVDKFRQKEREIEYMSNQAQLKGVIDNTLQDFVDNKKMFTAFDVTQKIRQSGIHVFHDVVKTFVHDCYENRSNHFLPSGYDRVTIPIGSPPPWLYYIPGVHDPDTYQQYVNTSSGVKVARQAKPATVAATLTKITDDAPLIATFGGIRRG